jgi:hypothetical protein
MLRTRGSQQSVMHCKDRGHSIFGRRVSISSRGLELGLDQSSIIHAPRPACFQLPSNHANLQVYVFMASVSGRTHQQRSTSRCSTCNNLDPRGHAYSRQDERSAGAPGKRKLPQWSTALSLPIDSRRLSMLTASNCRFCRLVVDVIQAFWPSWLDKRPSVTLNVGWNAPLRVSLVGQDGIRKLVEIFCSRGKQPDVDHW